MEIKEIVTAVFLLINGWTDIKKRQISLLSAGLYALTGVVCSAVDGREIRDFMVPLGISLIFLALGVLTRGQLGLGDGWLLFALSFMLETEEYLKTILVGMMLAAAISGILLIFCRKNRKTEIPLVPFLFLGYIGGVIF